MIELNDLGQILFLRNRKKKVKKNILETEIFLYYSGLPI